MKKPIYQSSGTRGGPRRLAGIATAVVAVVSTLSFTGAPAASAAVIPGYEIAFQSASGRLGTVEPNGMELEHQLGMAAGTSPSVTALGDGASSVFAFQSAAGNLGTFRSATGSTQFRTEVMAAGSSPAIVLDPGNHVQTIYHTNGNELNKSIEDNAGRSLVSGVAPGSSPAVSWNLLTNSKKFIYAGADGLLREATGNGGSVLIGGGLPVRAGTSPAVAAGRHDWTAAFNGAGGRLVVYRSTNGQATDTGQPLAAGSNPSIAALSTGGYVTAYVSGGTLRYLDLAGSPHDTGLAVSAGTNPAIAANNSGGWRIAYSAAGDNRVMTYDSTGQVFFSVSFLRAGTSPAIIAIAAPAPTSCRLSVVKPSGSEHGTFTGRIDCTYRPGERFSSVDLKGSDPVFDDDLFSARVPAGEGGLTARWEMTARRTNTTVFFDEDPQPLDDDEIYGVAHITNSAGGGYTVRTNTVSGDFSAGG